MVRAERDTPGQFQVSIKLFKENLHEKLIYEQILEGAWKIPGSMAEHFCKRKQQGQVP